MDQPIKALDAADAWRTEVDHHVRRAMQEEYMAANTNLPAAKIAHRAMSDRHVALANAAEMAAIMDASTDPHVADARNLGAALRNGCPVHASGNENM